MTTLEKRIETYQKSPKKIQELYESELAYALFDEIVEKYKIPEEKQNKYLHATGDVILGFYKIADLPRLLQTEVGLEKEVAQKLIGDLIDAWGPIVEREEAETETKKETLADLADSFAAKSAKPTEPPPMGQPSAEEKPELAKEPDVELTPAAPQPKAPSALPIVHGYGAMDNSEETQKEGSDETAEEDVIKATSQSDIKLDL